MKKNICITGLLNGFSERIAEVLAKDLDVFYANVLKLIQFDIVDVSNTIDICGVDYYKNLVAKKLKELSKFDDVVVFCNYYFFNFPNCKPIFKDNLITVYLDLGEKGFDEQLKQEKMSDLESKLEVGAYKVRNKYLTKISDIVINCAGRNESEIIAQIKEKVIAYFSKGVVKK